MFTKDELNEILKPWGNSVDNRPTPGQADDGYAYSKPERKRAYQMARQWQNGHHNPLESDETITDFICHQSDVIEMLANALGFANSRIAAMEERITNLTKAIPTKCEKCIYGDDFDCPAPLPTGYLCQKGHGSHTGDWFCADGTPQSE